MKNGTQRYTEFIPPIAIGAFGRVSQSIHFAENFSKGIVSTSVKLCDKLKVLMRKLILNVAVSLDGFIEGPNGEYDWCFTDQDYGLEEFYNRIDTVFIGRKSYELLLKMEVKGEYSLSKLKEYVFSTTLDKVRDGAELISGDIENLVGRIKQEEGKDIWLFGGASLTTSMMNFGLVDELQLAVHPLLLGKGTPLFRNLPGRVQLSLEETKKYASGLVILKYAVLNIK